MKTKRKTSYLAYENNKVPYIRISGKWLEDIGFRVGENFSLDVKNNQILLKPQLTNCGEPICKT